MANKWTPEQRAKFIATMKERHSAKRKRKRKESTSKTSTQLPQSDIPEGTLSYALGFLEAWVSSYAGGEGVSARTLAYRLGQLLQRKASR